MSVMSMTSNPLMDISADRPLFVTGTDTGIGKTLVAAGFILAWGSSRFAVQPVKPVACGGRVGSHDDWPVQEDVYLLGAAAYGKYSAAEINPYFFDMPKAPTVASAAASVTIDEARINDRVAAILAAGKLPVIEGAGGIMVPMTDHMTFADWAGSWHMRAIIVARAGLGTLNHTALTIEAARRRGVDIHAVILNMESATSLDDAESNRRELNRFCDVPLHRIFVLKYWDTSVYSPAYSIRRRRLTGVLSKRGWIVDADQHDYTQRLLLKITMTAVWMGKLGIR